MTMMDSSGTQYDMITVSLCNAVMDITINDFNE